jgi:hypothetical protein
MRRGLALSVTTFLLLIPPLSYLEQPDPLWISGIWDDDDFDGVVVLVKSTEVPCDSDHSVVVAIEPSRYAPPIAPEWRRLPLHVRWPENRAPPDA